MGETHSLTVLCGVLCGTGIGLEVLIRDGHPTKWVTGFSDSLAQQDGKTLGIGLYRALLSIELHG